MAGRFIVPADQVGETIRKVRVDAGFTDIAVADVLQIPLASYRSLERGEGGISIGTLYALADALQTAPDRFFGGAGA